MRKAFNKGFLIYFLYFILVIYFIGAVLILSTLPQKTIFDPGLCLKMTQNIDKHIPFNYYSHPSPANIDKDEFEFVTWWSPGQFAVPLFFQKCLEVKLGVSLKITIMLCMVISALGIFKLYYELLLNTGSWYLNGLPTTTLSLIFCAFTILQPFFWSNLFYYDGGGVLLLAYSPWFIFWAIKIKQINIYTFLGLLCAAVFGFFLKTAFTSIFIGSVFYLFLSKSIIPDVPLKSQNFRKLITYGVYCLTLFLIYVLITKLAFLNHNRNITNSSLGIRVQPRVLFYPIVAPIIALFSLGHVLVKSYTWIIASIFILPLYYLIMKSDQLTALYKNLIISYVCTNIVCFFLIYLSNVDVSYETRHFVILAILIAPAVFIAIGKFKPLKILSVTLFCCLCIISFCFFAEETFNAYNSKTTIIEKSGLTTDYPSALINELKTLDSSSDKGKDIFYFTDISDPSIALAITNNRVLLGDCFVNFHFINQQKFKPNLYYGTTSGKLYVVSELNLSATEPGFKLNTLERYKEFKKIFQVENFGIFEGISSKK